MDVKSVTSIAKTHIYITSHFVKKTNRMRFICTTLHRRQIAQYVRREKKNKQEGFFKTFDCLLKEKKN